MYTPITIGEKMIEISARNVEKIAFADKLLQSLLPDLADVFGTYYLGIRSAADFLVRKAMVEFLEKVTDAHVDIISNHLNSIVSVQKLDQHLHHSYSTTIDDLENFLGTMRYFSDNVVLSRD